jgi:hypothetical protein
MLKLFFFAILISTCLAAQSHLSKDVPKKICDKKDGWTVFKVKDNNFNPPSGYKMARNLLERQMKELRPAMIKDAAAEKYSSSPSKNATLFTTFGTDRSWVLDGCMKVNSNFPQ